MTEFIIRKTSDRRAAVAQLRALQIARRSLMHEQHSDPTIKVQARIDDLAAQIQDIKDAMSRYDQIRNFGTGRNGSPRLTNTLSELPRTLIEWRLRMHVSLKALSKRCGIRESVLSEYERTGYQNVSLRRIKRIVVALESFMPTTQDI